jgi:hypothetical protein
MKHHRKKDDKHQTYFLPHFQNKVASQGEARQSLTK